MIGNIEPVTEQYRRDRVCFGLPCDFAAESFEGEPQPIAAATQRPNRYRRQGDEPTSRYRSNATRVLALALYRCDQLNPSLVNRGAWIRSN